MTRIFVYEYCTALGPGSDSSDPARGLFRMGQAMRDAAADDFRRVPGVEVVTLGPVGAGDHEAEFERLAGRCDWSLVIAPEIGGLLAKRCETVLAAGGHLLGSSVEAVRTAGDKLRLAESWKRNGVRCPRTWLMEEWPAEHFPAVVKPRSGAGSVSTVLVRDASERTAIVSNPAVGDLIAQDHVPGKSVSVSFLLSEQRGSAPPYFPAGSEDGGVQPRRSPVVIPLMPSAQLLSTDGRFRYEGCELPIRADLADRAVSLGRRAVVCVPGLLGYVGVDLVLGDAADGSQDYAIEINPRLSMSYIALRALADFNIAEAILRSANGEAVPEPQWKTGRVRMGADWVAEQI